MVVRVTFTCDGCGDTAEGTDRMRKHFASFSGRDYGLGTVRQANTVEDVAPEGWVAYDPYTHATYCQQCWRSIVDKETSHE